jgi:hypothetical protein
VVKSCIRFHYVVRGSAWLSVDKADEPRVALSGGDLAVLPLGHAHALRDHPRSTTRRFEEVARCATHPTHSVIHIDLGARGPETTFITGAFVLDDPLATPILATILQLLPAAAFVSLGLVVLFNVVLLCRRFPEKRPFWLTLVSLREWKAPDFLVWGVIVSGFSMFIPGLESLKTLAANFLLVFGACYFFQGLAIIAFYFNKNNVPRFVRGVVYLFIVFQQIFTLLVVGLGLFDLWVDFRRLRKQDLNPSQAS